VQGLKQEVLRTQKHFVIYAQKFVTLAQQNAKNYRLMAAANLAPQLAKNVRRHVQACK